MSKLKIRKYFKSILKKTPRLYFAYTSLRYIRQSKLRSWVLKNQRYIEKNNLSTVTFEGGECYFKSPHGVDFRYVPEVMGGLLGLETNNGFEQSDLTLVLDAIQPDSVFLDVGANFGVYTISVAKLKPGSQVHAFEPVSETAEYLRENIIKNSVQNNVIVNTMAVGEAISEGVITTDRYAGNFFAVEGDYDGLSQPVLVNTLDNYVAENKIKTVDFIKCDVEGAELMVMKGSSTILSDHRPIVLLEIAQQWTERFGYSPDELKEFMASHNYVCRTAEQFSRDREFKITGAASPNNFFFIPR